MADGRRKMSLLDELKFLQDSKQEPSKSTGKKKVKKRSGVKKTQKKNETEEDMTALNEPEEFEYKWPTCACGMNHPPVPHFSPPDGIRCSYYWQIADRFPFISLHRTLTTEIKFIQADKDESGLIELPEMKELLQDVFGEGKLSERMLERAFKEIDLDKSGTIDFFEVISILYDLVQRSPTNLPATLTKGYSKVCSIQ